MFNYIEKMLSLEENSVTSFEKRNNELFIFMTLSRKPHVCPYCHQRTDAIKDYRQQMVLCQKIAQIKMRIS
jgi:transposase